jgi:phosphopantothenoylcysteine decarboxylase / phosphopantothenate---cysteine ligase
VSGDVMGGDRNRVHLITDQGVEDWPEAAKDEVARHLIDHIAQELG